MSSGLEHADGDCWPSQCPHCEAEDTVSTDAIEDFEICGDLVTAYVTGQRLGDTIELQVGRGFKSLKAHEAEALGAWLLEAAEVLGGGAA